MSKQIDDVRPYHQSAESKKHQVRKMFDNIAPHYDFLNHFLSAGMDIRWRKRAIAMVGAEPGERILDMATGTGDMAIALARTYPGTTVLGVDLAPQMLRIASKKTAARQLGDRITYQEGDSEQLPMADGSFHHATVAFGVRNFEHLERGLAEMHRVLKPGGRIVVLEFTKPRSFPFKQLFNAYFRYLLPLIGKIRSGDNRAYKYLYESVQAFPDYERFNRKLEEAGFRDARYKALTLGICAIYTAVK
ncbi:MAG: bifunctional demethylmenaquinone methyltransferase/2-methoxy-6-polyprenyl-1,4-benzoquinol methylase UbiE [Saprospiraceae bacterium]|nr:bifunctional demethylmenaquinone methyltransferase/2-methoxy-6-polyprenyl-1,4-benzoquinol methylase UbiE [Saprospiraceae bacterium]